MVLLIVKVRAGAKRRTKAQAEKESERHSTPDVPPLPRPKTRRGTSQPWGVRAKRGSETIPLADWRAIRAFVASMGNWMLADDPALPRDLDDPLTAFPRMSYGAFMMGFDFHLTPEGPKLIEINTNAGGLATVIDIEGRSRSGRSARPADELLLEAKFVEALRSEFRAGSRSNTGPLRHVCIVDDAVTKQRLYPEMLRLRDVVRSAGIACDVTSPEELCPRAGDGRLVVAGSGAAVDLIYNRLAPDFRLTNPSHAHLRQAALSGTVVITPHPAVYVRAADKRQLPKLYARQQEQGRAAIVPETHLLASRPLGEWWADRDRWVFKPPDGHGSRGVKLGPALRQRDLRAMGPDTVVQRLWLPSDCGGDEENCSFDLRIYTVGTNILAVTTRQFGKGGKMEMSSAVSGFKKALPAGVASVREVVDPDSLTLLNTSLRILHHLQQQQLQQRVQQKHGDVSGLPGPPKLARMTTNEFRELRAQARDSTAAAVAAPAPAPAALLPVAAEMKKKAKKSNTKAKAKPKDASNASKRSTFRTAEALAADARAKAAERARASKDLRQQAELRLRRCTGDAMRAWRASGKAQGDASSKKVAKAFAAKLAALKKELLASLAADVAAAEGGDDSSSLEETFRERAAELM